MEANKDQLRLQYVPLEELVRWPGNPKQHDDELIERLVRRFGFDDPVALDENTGRLVEGHGRLDMLQRMQAAGEDPPARIIVDDDGTWHVPLLRGIEFEDESEAEAYLIGHNRSVERGGWFDELLAVALQRVETRPRSSDRRSAYQMPFRL